MDPKGLFTPSVSVNAAITLLILFSLKTMELLHNVVAAHFRTTPLFFNENSIASVIGELT